MKYPVLTTVGLAVTLGLAANSSQAHGSSIHSNSCDVDMSYNINIDDKNIRLSEDEREFVQIDANNNLYLKGEKQQLSAKQQALLNDYADEVREFLPVVDEVATEATHLALDAVTDVSKMLLDKAPDKAEKLRSRVQAITSKVKQHVSDKHLHPKSLEAYLDDRQFEEEFEEIVRDVVADVVQGSIGDVIAAAIRGDEAELEAFEARMEQFGKDMETRYEKRAEIIEEKAEDLCNLVEKIDQKEDSFIEEFGEYKKYQLIRAD